MLGIIKSSFFWQVAGGFVLGTLGVLAIQPAEATRTLASHFALTAPLSR